MNNQQQTAAEVAMGTPTVLRNPTDVNMENLLQEFRLSKEYVTQYTKDFPQLDSLVDAIPLVPSNDAPFVGDTTLAGLVRQIMRDSLQQLPVFSVRVNGSKKTVASQICTYLLKKYAFNEDTFGKGLLSTLQIGGEQAVTHGYAPFLVATGLMYNDFGTTMRLLHHTDTAPEPGIMDANESSYHYVVSHPTPSRARRIRNNAKSNPKTSWIVDALNKLLTEVEPKPTDYSIHQDVAHQNKPGEDASPVFEFVTRYPVGDPSEPIVTFSPQLPESPLRVMESRSKWAYPRVQYLVIDPAPLTPFGISRVRLASPNMNLMNIYLGNVASMLLLNSKPPIFKRGRFLTPVQLKQGVVWETLDPNGQAELKTLDNGTLAQFPTMAQHFAGQIQNIMGGRTMTVNAGSKASGFSKTGPGVKQSEDYQDSNTNQITKILENFLRQYGLVALDTIFCEQEGVEGLIVDDETKDAINAIQPGFVGDDNTVEMDWATFYDAIKEWSVDIDVSLSKDELDEKKRGDLQDMLVVLGQNAQELGPQAVQKVEEITNMLMQDKAPLVKPLPLTSGAPTVPGQVPPPAAAPVVQ